MDLTNEQIQAYHQDGYTVIRGLISAVEASRVRTRLIEVFQGKHDWPPVHFQVLNPEQFRNPDGSMIPVGVQGPAKCEEVFKSIADHPHLKTAMAQLLGGAVTRYTDQALIKHRDISGQSFYHQDSYYWRLAPERGCNAWIALDEVGADASALAIVRP